MRRQLGWGLVCAAALLAGCGGGGSSSGGSTSTRTVTSTGKFLLAYSGGTVPGVKHAYVTITKVVLNEDLNRSWSPTDTTWQTVTLGFPVTIDLAAGNGFIVGSASGGVSVPVGTYQQVRLILAGQDAPLEASASATGLTFNAQVEYDDGKIVPLELPNVQAGFRLDRGVSITATTAQNDAVGGVTAHIDLDRNLVRFNGGYADRDAATLRMRSFSTRYGSDGGVIFGQIDPTLLCDSPTATSTTACARDVTVSLYQQSLDDLFTRYNNLYTVKVNPSATTDTGVEADGTFLMGPLNPDTGESRIYDVVIRGRGMRTMVIQSVPLKSVFDGVFNATDVANWASAIGTYVGKTWTDSVDNTTVYRSYIRPVLIGSDVESQASVASAQSPMSSRMVLGLRLSSSTNPYELVAANTDPFTGLMKQPVWLPKGDPVVATFSTITNEVHTARNSEPIFSGTFVSTTPTDGSGTLIPMALGRYYDDAAYDVAHPVADTATSFSPVPLAFKTGVQTTPVTVTATGIPNSGWDKAYLVVSDVGGIVYTEDVTADISGGGLTKTVTLPKGTVSNGYATGVYSFAIRTRLTGGTSHSDTHWYRSASQLDLRTGTATSITIP